MILRKIFFKKRDNMKKKMSDSSLSIKKKTIGYTHDGSRLGKSREMENFWNMCVTHIWKKKNEKLVRHYIFLTLQHLFLSTIISYHSTYQQTRIWHNHPSQTACCKIIIWQFGNLSFCLRTSSLHSLFSVLSPFFLIFSFFTFSSFYTYFCFFIVSFFSSSLLRQLSFVVPYHFIFI